MTALEELAADVLERRSLQSAAPPASSDRSVPQAFDVSGRAAVGAVALLARTRSGWYCSVIVCLHEDGAWRELESTGDRWPLDPGSRPDGQGFELSTSTFGFQIPGGPWVASLAGVVGSKVSSLGLDTAEDRRLVDFNPNNGIFVAAITSSDTPSFTLTTYVGHNVSDTLRYEYPS